MNTFWAYVCTFNLALIIDMTFKSIILNTLKHINYLKLILNPITGKSPVHPFFSNELLMTILVLLNTTTKIGRLKSCGNFIFLNIKILLTNL